jgi:hypothetical protein
MPNLEMIATNETGTILTQELNHTLKYTLTIRYKLEIRAPRIFVLCREPLCQQFNYWFKFCSHTTVLIQQWDLKLPIFFKHGVASVGQDKS